MLRYAGHGMTLMMAETETRQYQNAWSPSAYAATTEECWLDLPTMAILEKGGVYLFRVMRTVSDEACGVILRKLVVLSIFVGALNVPTQPCSG